MDPLISKGIHYGALATLTSVGSHYGSVDFDAVGLGYASNRFDDDILAIGSVAVCGAEGLARKVPATAIRTDHQSPGA